MSAMLFPNVLHLQEPLIDMLCYLLTAYCLLELLFIKLYHALQDSGIMIPSLDDDIP